MHTQVFLGLKKTGDIDTLLAPSGGSNALRDVIFGDSLEVPFLKWIRVTGLNNAVGFSSGTVRGFDAQGNYKEKKYGHSAGTYRESFGVKRGGRQNVRNDDWLDGQSHDTDQDGFDSVHHYDMSYLNRFRRKQYTNVVERYLDADPNQHKIDRAPTTSNTQHHETRKMWDAFHFQKFSKTVGNDKLPITLPEHEELTFTKRPDNSTPQLAYACSCQEPIRHAIFAFRRKIGTGVEGIRVPFMLIWLKQCLVTGWELNGDEETVTLQYEKIKWCTYDQTADWNMPTGMSNREWDTQDNAGGEDISMYVKMGVLAAAAMAAGAALGFGLGAAFESKLGTASGDSTDAIEALEGGSTH